MILVEVGKALRLKNIFYLLQARSRVLRELFHGLGRSVRTSSSAMDGTRKQQQNR